MTDRNLRTRVLSPQRWATMTTLHDEARFLYWTFALRLSTRC